MSEFKSLAEIFSAAHATPAISPLITEAPPPVDRAPVEVERSDDRLIAARVHEQLDAALECLLREIACEVVGRELLLAPVDVDAIVARLRQRYRIERGAIAAHDGDVTIATGAGEIDASLGRRLRAAIDRALE